MATQMLRGIPLFEGMSDDQLARRGLHVSTRPLSPGRSLFASGERREQVWFVRSGWLQLRIHDQGGLESTVELAGPGSMVGYANDFKHATHFSTATAITEVAAVGVPVKAFERWVAEDARASARVIESLNARLADSFELKAIASERSTVRLRLVLLWLQRRLGASMPVTRALLSDLTGLRAETCSRGLSALRRKGALKVSPRLIQVVRPELLRGRGN